MTDYVKREINNIEAIASRCTESQADGYSQIMRICEALQEEIDEAYKKPQFEGATSDCAGWNLAYEVLPKIDNEVEVLRKDNSISKDELVRDEDGDLTWKITKDLDVKAWRYL